MAANAPELETEYILLSLPTLGKPHSKYITKGNECLLEAFEALTP